MKKSFLLLVLLMAGFLFVFPSQVEATPVDMVILLDTSWSVLPSFKGMLNFIEMDIISEYLRFGDTLHFITFDEKPYLVFSRQINNRNDFEFVINHLSLLHPFGNFTDIIAAVKFLREYVSGISRNSAKKIIILTDGVHNPSYESPYESVICPRTGVNLFEREVEELERANWKVRIVLVPGDGQRESTTSRGTSRISAPAEPRTAAAQQNQAPAHGQPATPAQPAAPGTTFVQNQPPVPTPVMPTTYP
ncbi:MAG: VWA domain-containing protein, partial [Spirochaetes bacterium]|nr:VWA domain-containing protein [Spirochaetota bacterium]